VRGRLGYLITPTLLAYATGGLAYGGVNSSVSIFQTILGNTDPIPAPPSILGGGYSNTRAGWTAGGGMEWMLMPNWSAKLEYLYYDLGSASYPVGGAHYQIGFVGTALGCSCGGGGSAASAVSAATRFNGHIVRAGVNYHFNWFAPAPALAKY
jgi:outer membrane immunogenic protein